jgi:hypothetical protein
VVFLVTRRLSVVRLLDVLGLLAVLELLTKINSGALALVEVVKLRRRRYGGDSAAVSAVTLAMPRHMI